MNSETDRITWMRQADPVFRELLDARFGISDGISTLARWEFLRDHPCKSAGREDRPLPRLRLKRMCPK